MKLAQWWRRDRAVRCTQPSATPPAKPLHGAACQCWLCGYTVLLPTYSLVRPFTQRMSG